MIKLILFILVMAPLVFFGCLIARLYEYLLEVSDNPKFIEWEKRQKELRRRKRKTK